MTLLINNGSRDGNRTRNFINEKGILSVYYKHRLSHLTISLINKDLGIVGRLILLLRRFSI
jgi:hypothetical protein